MASMLILGLFVAALVLCVVCKLSVLYALLFGYAIFFLHGLYEKFTAGDMLRASFEGLKKVKNVVIAMVLIGMLTALWRASGTIAYIICNTASFIKPAAFILIAFVLNCLISFLTGTAFGTAGTMGVITMTIGSVLGANPLALGGAILSGAYFGDRCSPVSSSALLVSELTGSDIFDNIKKMLIRCIVPFCVACVLFLLMGNSGELSSEGVGVLDAMRQHYVLNLFCLIPAVLLIVLALLRVPMRKTLIACIGASLVICLFVQKQGVGEICRMLVMGYDAGNEAVSLMNGGGIVSMAKVIAIVSLSSCYMGIFEKTGLLDGVGALARCIADKTTRQAAIFVCAAICGMISCNQTLSIMLTYQLCDKLFSDKQELALCIEDSAVVMAPLVPWSIACEVTLTTVGAPIAAFSHAFYLMLVPLWMIACAAYKKRKQK